MAPKRRSLRGKRGTFLLDLLVPLAVGGAMLLFWLTPVGRNLDTGLFDVLLHLKAPVAEDPRILLVDIDDQAIEKLGAWPWPRSFMAKGLPLLAEFGVKTTVLDIEYNTPSPPGIDRTYLAGGLKQDFDATFRDLSGQMADLFSALKARQIPLSEADGYVNDLLSAADEAKGRLYRRSQGVAIDNDTALARAIGLSGTTGLAYRLVPGTNEALTTADRKVVLSKAGFASEGRDVQADRFGDLIPSLPALMAAAHRSGFVNIEIDLDGKRRRIKLVETVGQSNYGQLVFAPLMDWLGNPLVEVTPGALVLRGARYPEGSVDLTIPLDATGALVVNWSPKPYAESFKHLSFYYLVRYQDQWDQWSTTLADLARRDSWTILGGNPAADLAVAQAELENLMEEALRSPSEAHRKAWFEAKDRWLADGEALVSVAGEAQVLAALDEAAARERRADQRSLLVRERSATASLLASLRDQAALIRQNQKVLKQALEGTFCIVGYVGTGTTDLGATPFQKEYLNAGTHASVVNSILQKDFLGEVPPWIPLSLTLAFPLALFLVIRKLPPLGQSLAGVSSLVLLLGTTLGLFLSTQWYLPVSAPFFATFLTFLALTVLRFLRESRDKDFLRKAFGTYLSKEVIQEIIDDPSRLKLGGESRTMTAMFTDIKGFSTVSELLTAEQLVQLLNAYLTGMSDLILANGGIIDKYEGDAILAFWGAPLDSPGHIRQSLTAAMQMKRLEPELNARFRQEGLSPQEILTRVGIHSGEMVVGNMGTDQKMNYTIMGNAVNLASRLESVNKLYGTWVMSTDTTVKDAGEGFVFRRLDRVRVVGIQTPVMLQEVVGFREDLDSNRLGFLEGFHGALTLFEAQRWADAERAFADLLRQAPGDGPSQLYLKRCQEFGAKAPSSKWDGVFNLTEK